MSLAAMTQSVDSPSGRRHHREGLARQLAVSQGGVVSRAQLRRVGITRKHVQAELEAQRWRSHGSRTIAVHTGDLSGTATQWRAVWEVGRSAALDGVSALHAAGLVNFVEEQLQVSVSRGSNPHHPDGVRVHETRRRADDDLVRAGIPRVRPAIAAVRGALWAVSNRQAALILVMTVQQRLAMAADIAEALGSVRRHPRRRFLLAVAADLTHGSESLGELDFARLCREHGLPEPDRQVVRRGPRGRVYLDVRWHRPGLVVEIDGIHHDLGLAPVDDALRQNSVTLAGDVVLRIPVMGLRLQPDAFMAQVRRAYDELTARGR